MKKLLSTVICAIFLSGSALAQVTTAFLSGVVTNGNTAVENATIKAVLTTTNASYTANSRSGGVYDISNLNAGGPYTVTISAPGMKDIVFTDVFLTLGENFKLDADFTTEKIGGVVVSVSRNATKTGSNLNINSRTLNTLPTISRSINDFTRLTPQAGSGSSFNGRDGRFNNITIDGANFNNNFGLSDKNLPGGDAQPISLDAIEAVQVNISPFDVRQSNFTGAGINAITKSGSNTTTASVYTLMRNESFNGTKVDTFDLGEQKKTSSNILGFRLGGALVKDKIFYFVNYENEKTSLPGLQWKASRPGTGQSASDPNLSRTLASDLDLVRTHLKEKYGYETGDYENLGNFNTANQKFLARLDWNISEKHKFSLRYNSVHNTNDQVLNGTSAPNPRSSSNRWSNNSMSFANSNYSFDNKVWSVAGELKSNLSNKVSNQLLLTYTSITDARGTNSTPFPFVDIKKGGDNYISFGYELFSYNNKVNNNTLSFIDNITYNLNKHTITAGVAYDQMYVGNAFQRYGTSYYRYDSLSQFLNGAAPSAFALTYGYGGDATPVGAELSFGQLAGYVQDEFRASKKLKITAGLRVDVPVYTSESKANAGFAKYDTAALFKDPSGTPIKYNPNSWPTGSPLVSPRVGFNYDVKGDKDLIIRGGTGVFTGRLPFVWFTNQPSNAYGVQATVEVTKAADLAGYVFNADPTAYLNKFPTTPGTLPSGASFAKVDNDFKFPQVWRTSIGIDKKLPFDLDFSADIIYTKELNGVYQYNANYAKADTTYFTGTEWERAAYKKAASRSYVGTVREAMVLSNTNLGSGLSAAFTLSRNFKKGLSGSISYAFNNTKDITSNPGSQAASAWSNNRTVGGNNAQELAISEYSTPNRVIANISKKLEYGNRFATTVSLVYDGYNPGRYSYVYSTDINNDGLTGNDLLFVHASSEIKFSDVVVSGKTITAADQAAAWDAYVAQDKYLSAHKGQFVERNGGLLPWLHRFDLRLLQDIAQNIGKNKHTLQLSADILNIGNMINPAWGIRKQLTVSNGGVLRYNAANGTYNFNAVNGVLPVESFRPIVSTSTTWGMQLGLRYSF
jgi:hypothetical protein